MRKTKGFSYDLVKDKDVIDHIDKQVNGSQYMWGLVRKDIKKSSDSIEIVVRKVIEEYMKDKTVKVESKDSKVNITKREVEGLLGGF